MTAVFDHIRQMKYLLQQLLESGFLSGRGFEEELGACKDTAHALGLDTAGELLAQLSAVLNALRAGQGEFSDAARIYSDLTMYYEFIAKKLIVENIAIANDIEKRD